MAANLAVPPTPAAKPPVISASRRVKNRTWWVLCSIMLICLVGPVVWILAGTIASAAAHWQWSILWTKTQGTGGGLAAAIVGTFWLMVWIGVVTALVGIGAGVYLAEFAGSKRHATILRSATGILSGIPSIVFGYCAYLTLVVGLHWGYGLVPATIAVSLLVVPYVSKSTELALNQVPVAYHEGGEALGMTKSYMLRRVVMRSAIPGILTGLIVAMAISVGETAPLLYTAGYSNTYPNGAFLHSQIGYLPGAIYTNYNSAIQAQQWLSKDAALLLIVLVLILILATRLVVVLTQKFSPNRSASSGGRRQRHETEAAIQAADARVAAARDLRGGTAATS